MKIVTYILIGVVVVLLCIIFMLIKKMSSLKQEPIGKLRIDSSDPYDGPYLFLELKQSVEAVKLQDKKYVLLEVDATDFLSQK